MKHENLLVLVIFTLLFGRFLGFIQVLFITDHKIIRPTEAPVTLIGLLRITTASLIRIRSLNNSDMFGD